MTTVYDQVQGVRWPTGYASRVLATSFRPEPAATVVDVVVAEALAAHEAHRPPP